ncbi:multiheme c-type cytochrome [Hydrogenimonas sp.]
MFKHFNIVLLSVLSPLLLYAVYMTNKSCDECHPDIYDEFKSSYHSKNYFNDELHRRVAELASQRKYDCGACHMPAAKNLKAMERGLARPNPIHKRQKEGVSCFYCHEIAFVKEAHKRNKIVLAKQAEGYKPTIFGSLKNPDSSDKHSMVKSPIYKRYACVGCHSHKVNDHNVTIFRAMKKGESSESCIKCHMPLTPGPPEKMNKKARQSHHSHRFEGIHDASMRKKAVDINISAKPGDTTLKIVLVNKMGHPLIIQAARMKYLKIEILRDGKVIWKNFSKSPYEDKKGTFVTEFVDKDGHPVAIPSFAFGYGFVNNLEAKEKRTLVYKVPILKKGDKISVSLMLYLVKPSCWSTLKLKDKSLMEPILMEKKIYEVK